MGTVVIEVRSGVASCTAKPGDVEVKIIDWDDIEESNR